MKHLIKAVKKEAREQLKKTLTEMETEEGLKQVLKHYGKTYKNNEKVKLTKYIQAKHNKNLKTTLAKIDRVNNAKPLINPFIITVEWEKSRMWGMNPKAYTNYGFNGSSIGGCGYDKKSAATAEALNSCDFILKLLYLKKDRALKKWEGKNIHNDLNRSVLGYGSGYGIIPCFEGGVGVSCHKNIIEGLNLKWQSITNAKHTDVYMITL